MKLKICVAGATGKVGRGLVEAIHASEDLELVSAISRTYQNQNLGIVLHNPQLNVPIFGTAAEALNLSTDVLVDYTKPNIVKKHVLTALSRKVRVVIGTSGLSDDDYAEIDEQARLHEVGVIAAGNFAITAVLMQRFAEMAAKYISQWEVIEYSGAGKVDAPSGTARELVFRLSNVQTPVIQHPIEQTQGFKESRGATLNGMQVHSVRLPGFMSSCEVILGMPGEKLTIRHDSIDASAPYISGTLLAVRKVPSIIGLLRGLDRVMEL